MKAEGEYGHFLLPSLTSTFHSPPLELDRAVTLSSLLSFENQLEASLAPPGRRPVPHYICDVGFLCDVGVLVSACVGGVPFFCSPFALLIL